MTVRADLRQHNQTTIPAEVRAALSIEPGDILEFTIDDGRNVSVRGLKPTPADQAWFWTPQWQAGEREVDEQIAAGLGTVFYSDEEFDAWLATH